MQENAVQVNAAIESVIARSDLAGILRKVQAEERLSFEDGLRLYASSELAVLGYLANIVREKANGNIAYYVRNQHINYTNICSKLCKFCSFYVPPRDSGGYVVTPDEIRRRVLEHIEEPVTEIHIVGGVNPALPYDYYLDIVKAVKEIRPHAQVKAFTMIELLQIQRVGRKPMDEVLKDLIASGVSSLPGGGAEVFSERVRDELFWTKADAEQWLDVARIAHTVGLRSNATMLYGHVENAAEKAGHLIRLRELQDETGGFMAYIPLSWHPEGTCLPDLPGPTGCQDLKEIAVGRLMLDNFPHIKTFWVMNGIDISQIALWYGADDMDGTVLRYEITGDAQPLAVPTVATTAPRPAPAAAAAGRTASATSAASDQALSPDEIISRIVEAGREPVERDSLYGRLRVKRSEQACLQ